MPENSPVTVSSNQQSLSPDDIAEETADREVTIEKEDDHSLYHQTKFRDEEDDDFEDDRFNSSLKKTTSAANTTGSAIANTESSSRSNQSKTMTSSIASTSRKTTSSNKGTLEYSERAVDIASEIVAETQSSIVKLIDDDVEILYDRTIPKHNTQNVS